MLSSGFFFADDECSIFSILIFIVWNRIFGSKLYGTPTLNLFIVKIFFSNFFIETEYEASSQIILHIETIT